MSFYNNYYSSKLHTTPQLLNTSLPYLRNPSSLLKSRSIYNNILQRSRSQIKPISCCSSSSSSSSSPSELVVPSSTTSSKQNGTISDASCDKYHLSMDNGSSSYASDFPSMDNDAASYKSDFPSVDNDATSYKADFPRAAKSGTPWIYTVLPDFLVPHAQMARIHMLIGNYLVFFPTAWSIALAGNRMVLPNVKLIGLFAFISLLTQSAGCIINDIVDQDIDAKVERTKSRPIPSGRVTTPHAFVSYGVLIALATLLAIPLNSFSQCLVAFHHILMVLYPFMKRWTYWPQAFLGITMNWGIFSGWASVKGAINIQALFPIYISGICWTLIYDTIYAHLDKEEDLKAGVKSTALLFGDDAKTWFWGFTTLITFLLCICGTVNHLGFLYYLGVMAGISHLVWQITTVNLKIPRECGSKFISNKWYGLIVLISIILGRLS